jgi:hypothetical protein
MAKFDKSLIMEISYLDILPGLKAEDSRIRLCNYGEPD